MNEMTSLAIWTEMAFEVCFAVFSFISFFTNLFFLKFMSAMGIPAFFIVVAVAGHTPVFAHLCFVVLSGSLLF